MILIITNKEDEHPTPVIKILNKRNIPVFRLNTECLLTDYEFTWWNSSADKHLMIINKQTGLEVFDDDIVTVWDRRPELPKELPLKGSEAVNKHNLEEATGFLRFIRSYLSSKPSIGSINFDRYASSKIEQMSCAISVRFRVPETCISNRHVDILEIARWNKELVLKPIASDGIREIGEDTEYVFYSQKVSQQDIINAPKEAFTQTVTYIQNYIPKAFELRVTIVAKKVFACKIESQHLADNEGKIDWRQGYDHGLRYKPYDLPDDISEKCIKFLDKMRLNFGAFDFIVTPSGEYVFLECNPNGQWLWIEMETGLKISEAIANTLATGEGIIVY